MTEAQRLLRQIKAARLYTRELLRSLPEEDWFRAPTEGVTHIAWQVGHLAFAQYSLALRRIRGEQPEDEQLIPADFLAAYGRGSVPDVERSRSLGLDAIREVFDRVHQRVQQELSDCTDEQLSEPAIGPPHTMFKDKQGSLQWCVQHEFLHAGQIGLLRRLLGSQPLR